jgi:hypothetical protein
MLASQIPSGAMLYFTVAKSSTSYHLTQSTKRPLPMNFSPATNHHLHTFKSLDAKPMHIYPKKSATNLLPPQWSASTLAMQKITRPTDYTTSPPEGSSNPETSHLMKEQVHRAGSLSKWGPPYPTPQNHKRKNHLRR